MASIAASPRRSLIGAAVAAFQARAKAQRRPSRIAAAIVRAGDHAGTLASLASFDTAAWLHGATWGWIVAGICVLVAEYKIRGT